MGVGVGNFLVAQIFSLFGDRGSGENKFRQKLECSFGHLPRTGTIFHFRSICLAHTLFHPSPLPGPNY